MDWFRGFELYFESAPLFQMGFHRKSYVTTSLGFATSPMPGAVRRFPCLRCENYHDLLRMTKFTRTALSLPQPPATPKAEVPCWDSPQSGSRQKSPLRRAWRRNSSPQAAARPNGEVCARRSSGSLEVLVSPLDRHLDMRLNSRPFGGA